MRDKLEKNFASCCSGSAWDMYTKKISRKSVEVLEKSSFDEERRGEGKRRGGRENEGRRLERGRKEGLLTCEDDLRHSDRVQERGERSEKEMRWWLREQIG